MKTASAKSTLLEINYEFIPKVPSGQPFFIAHRTGFPQPAMQIPQQYHNYFALHSSRINVHSSQSFLTHSTETRRVAPNPPRLGR